MSIKKTYALVLGIVLAIVGILGLFTEAILGIFGVNLFQSVLHLVAAGFGIYAGTKGDGMSYSMIIGYIGVALAVLGFIPGVKDLLLTLLNINTATTLLHLVIGAVSLAVHYAVKE